MLTFNQCTKTPVFPETPEIEFESFSENTSDGSVTINLKFKDGDGDLGLASEDNSFPYQEYDYVKNGSGNYVEISDDVSNPPYDCKHYLIGQYNPDLEADTILIIPNPNYYNYIIEFYEKQGSSFVLYDFSNICPDYNSRFPLLSDKSEKGPIEGVLSYKLIDLKSLFLGETVKFKIFIQDRALHKSNVIETPEITIN